ncbi:MAG: histidine phosphatase family protein [Cyanobacteria bacterium J06554_11]
MSSQKTRVILVRHGRSTFNQQGRYQGSSDDSVLTSLGLRTAHQLGQALRHRAIDIVYTSPLRRVQQTARALIQTMSPGNPPPMVLSPQLREISLCGWEGLSYQQVRQQFAAEYDCWQRHPEAFELPVQPDTSAKNISTKNTLAKNISEQKGIALATERYFPVRDLYQRSQLFWQSFLTRHAGHNCLIVSHSGTTHALISTALGLQPKFHHSLQQSNCAVSELTFEETASSRSVQLHQLNHTEPLGETLPKVKTEKTGLRLILLPSEGLMPQHCQRIAQRLKEAPIDLCLTTSHAQAMAGKLLKHHPRALQLTTENAHFLQVWQQQLSRASGPKDGMITGLAITPTADIQTLIAQSIVNSAYSNSAHSSNLGNGTDPALSPAGYLPTRLALRPGRLNVVHYPANHRPVIQTINS